MLEPTDPCQTRTASLKMSIAGRPIEAQLEVPEGSARPRQLLPILQWLTNEVVEAACAQVGQQGKAISCRAGCGACCRQLVPISRAEAYRIAELVEQLPEPRRGEVHFRFQAAADRLAAAGLLERLDGPVSVEDGDARAVGMEYFRLGIACPFLDDESCSIHSDRPLACREYLVTSPAENCRQPTAETIHKVSLPVLVSNALLRLERSEAKEPQLWVPLVLAPRWAESHPEPAPSQTGPDLLGALLQQLTGRELSPTAGQEETQGGIGTNDRAVVRQRERTAAPTSQAEGQAQAYDEVPYEGRPFPFTHPDSLATIATLFGMTPPAVERCRVLELGCADGGNLIPMALGLPEGRFFGLDLSPRQISDGRRRVEQLALNNIDLRVMDLMAVDRSFGDFDFVICHGVFSWVPRPVQDKILAICSEQLAPQGVAYVSYNTNPGWRSRGMVREMVLYHVDAAAPPRERVRQARQFLDLLVRNTPPKSVYASVLQEEQSLWQKGSDAYVRHDQLADLNEPLYFHEFAGRLSSHGLQYITEANLADDAATPSEEVQQKLRDYRHDVVRFEQYLDFLSERTFRRSLLCHERVLLNRSPPPELIERFLLGGEAAPVSEEPRADSASSAQFRNPHGISVSTSNAWLKAALTSLLNHWPRLLSFEEVCSAARRQLGDSPDARLDPLADAALLKLPLLQCGMKGLVELHVRRWPNVAEVSGRPRANPLARLQAKTDRIVTNWRHAQVQLGEVDRQLLLQLDGRHTHTDLLRSLSTLAESGELTLGLGADDSTLSSPPALARLLAEMLGRFASCGLLDG